MKKNVLLMMSILMLALCGCATDNGVDNQSIQLPNKDDIESMQILGDLEVENEDSFYGEWKIQNYLTAPIYAISQEEIESYLTSTVAYYPQTFARDEQEITDIEYSFENVTQETFVQDYNIDISSWRTAVDEISYGTIVCEDNFFGSHFFIVDNETLWIYYEGVLFEAKK